MVLGMTRRLFGVVSINELKILTSKQNFIAVGIQAFIENLLSSD